MTVILPRRCLRLRGSHKSAESVANLVLACDFGFVSGSISRHIAAGGLFRVGIMPLVYSVGLQYRLIAIGDRGHLDWDNSV